MSREAPRSGGGALAEATQTTAGGLFLRRSSGLVREFGGWDVFVFNTVGYALGLVLAIIPLLMAGAVPEANVLLTVAVGTVFTVFNAMTYGYLSAALPRSGGEYVFLGRVVHPTVGFTASWGFTWSQLLGHGAVRVLHRQLRRRHRLPHARQRARLERARHGRRGRRGAVADVPAGHGDDPARGDHPLARPAGGAPLPQHPLRSRDARVVRDADRAAGHEPERVRPALQRLHGRARRTGRPTAGSSRRRARRAT